VDEPQCGANPDGSNEKIVTPTPSQQRKQFELRKRMTGLDLALQLRKHELSVARIERHPPVRCSRVLERIHEINVTPNIPFTRTHRLDPSRAGLACCVELELGRQDSLVANGGRGRRVVVHELAHW
jgi:hypothetical protein